MIKWIGEKYTCHDFNQENKYLLSTKIHAIFQTIEFIGHFNRIIRSFSMFFKGWNFARMWSPTRTLTGRRLTFFFLLRTSLRTWLRTRLRLKTRLRTRLRMRTWWTGQRSWVWLRLSIWVRLRHRCWFWLTLWFNRWTDDFWRWVNCKITFKKIEFLLFWIPVLQREKLQFW